MDTTNGDHLNTAFAYVKNAAPSPEFLARSRRIILALPNVPQRTSWTIGAAGKRFAIGTLAALTIMLMFFVIGLFTTPRLARLNNEEKLLEEARALDFQIQLNEAAYFEDAARAVSVALQEIFRSASGTDTSRNDAAPRVFPYND